jgi:hypothetical protein
MTCICHIYFTKTLLYAEHHYNLLYCKKTNIKAPAVRRERKKRDIPQRLGC